MGIGKELLALLERELSDDDLDEVESLLNRRADAIQLAVGVGVAVAPDIGQELMRQQQALEIALHQALVRVRQSISGAQASRTRLEEVRRLLSPVHSRLFNERM